MYIYMGECTKIILNVVHCFAHQTLLLQGIVILCKSDYMYSARNNSLELPAHMS